MLYVPKLIPASDKGGFFAIGRIFSGRVTTGMKVRIMGPDYVVGQERDVFTASVQRTAIWIGKELEFVDNVPCGNLVGMEFILSEEYYASIFWAFVAAFQEASKEGVLVRENMRGICFELMDVVLPARPKYRGNNQIVFAAKAAIYAAQRTAAPWLLEPSYMVHIQASEEALGAIAILLGKKHGKIRESMLSQNCQTYSIRAVLPGREYYEFCGALSTATSGRAFLLQCAFYQWEPVKSDPLEVGSPAWGLVRAIRARQGLKDPLLEFENTPYGEYFALDMRAFF
ncbi:hypothetical protein IFM89_003126 [Coptis chinensis]|uniref:Elongation factor EFG domain-containing protein n=1 Tax=Coptis chinensis TaxID=261450 RepID=A0A835IR03_9MAGN|nr:hypothetical protein IFM89_003126 [Coptis chinensis]